jgi:glycosyltransferase involved in cell wall biosynthesis
LGIPPEAPVVGTVAVFRTQKRLDQWLEAADLIRQKIPGAQFLLVGDGPEREKLLSIRKRLRLEDVVHMPGLASDVRPYLDTINVFLASSIFEGLPIALLEAMSMECAVVATSVGGIPELIEHGRDGHLVPPGRPDLLAEAVVAIASSERRLKEMGSAARNRVIDQFSIQRMTHRIECVYAEVSGKSADAG